MKEKVIKLLKRTLKEQKIKLEKIENLVEVPGNPEMGDYAFPCFSLSKILKKNPNQIAEELKSKIKLSKEFEKIKVHGAYINFFINKKEFVKSIVKEILTKKEDFGKREINLKGMVEFSQPNTHKAFHVGHIRGTSIGESLARIAEFFGEKVIRANYNGDTGMHVAK